jgi:hypothetical protein
MLRLDDFLQILRKCSLRVRLGAGFAQTHAGIDPVGHLSGFLIIARDLLKSRSWHVSCSTLGCTTS